MSELRKYRWVCSKCGSENVNCSGPMNFNYDKQEWVPCGTPNDDDFCEDCETECTLEQVFDEAI